METTGRGTSSTQAERDAGAFAELRAYVRNRRKGRVCKAYYTDDEITAMVEAAKREVERHEYMTRERKPHAVHKWGKAGVEALGHRAARRSRMIYRYGQAPKQEPTVPPVKPSVVAAPKVIPWTRSVVPEEDGQPVGGCRLIPDRNGVLRGGCRLPVTPYPCPAAGRPAQQAAANGAGAPMQACG